MNEIKAVCALRKGDKDAFKYFFKTYYDRLVAYIMTFTNDKMLSEDIVQQAFINFWDDRQKLDETKSPKNYLYAIVYNRYVDTIKKSKRQEKLMDQIWERALRERIMEDNEVLERRTQKIRQVLEILPPKCRTIILMNKVQGIKYRDIADQMGISVKTVESQMRIAFTKIREAFKEDRLLLFLMFKK